MLEKENPFLTSWRPTWPHVLWTNVRNHFTVWTFCPEIRVGLGLSEAHFICPPCNIPPHRDQVDTSAPLACVISRHNPWPLKSVMAGILQMSRRIREGRAYGKSWN